MKYIYAIMLALLLTACSASGDKQTEEKSDEVDHSAHMAEGKEQPKSKSPASQAMSIIGENHVHIEYHSTICCQSATFCVGIIGKPMTYHMY